MINDAINTWFEEMNAAHEKHIEDWMKKSEAGRFYAANLTVEAIQARLDRAIAKAGVLGSVTVSAHTDMSDGWADRDGIKIEGDKELVSRSVAWLEKALSPAVEKYRSMTGGQHAIYEADTNTGVVLFSRWSRGE